MSEDEKREFPHWEELYQRQEIESMPWFNPELDEDLKNALDELGLRGGSALDLGTGPGAQAIHLARRGFAVTATDISESAIHLARDFAGVRRRYSRSGCSHGTLALGFFASVWSDSARSNHIRGVRADRIRGGADRELHSRSPGLVSESYGILRAD